MSLASRLSVFTIPAGMGFADTLARGLFEEAKGQSELLCQYRIFLPTRRSCRVLRDSFLDITDGKPLLLPVMQPIGEVDENELLIHLPVEMSFDCPPAITPIQRRLLLAKTIQKMGGTNDYPEKSLALADALGRLMDQMIIEDVSFETLSTLVKEEFAQHWQITLDFLSILSHYWPKILEENGVIDAADRRNRLIRALKSHWDQHPPQTKIIAAGSTGTIPASAELMQTIAKLPFGQVILPGFDTGMDMDSWEAIDECHPQASLKSLLKKFDLSSMDIKVWPAVKNTASHRQNLLREIMRPAATSGSWKNISLEAIKPALHGLTKYECKTQQDEAQTIALAFRETLETPGKTAALVTPDRMLAQRVMMTCRKWGIHVDDSAGFSLLSSQRGRFISLILRCVDNECRPVSLLSLLKHPLFCFGYKKEEVQALVKALDKHSLRGNIFYKNFIDIWHADQKKEKPRLNPSHQQFLIRMDQVFANLRAMKTQRFSSFSDILTAHLLLAESLCSLPDKNGAEILWAEEDGESAAMMFADLRVHSDLIEDLSVSSYGAIIEQMMEELMVRPVHGSHPRLRILGALEARMVQSDVMILGGLNEGTWPPAPALDPWMSRPMRKDAGLPGQDRRTGLSAHDFSQGFCADTVILTRSMRVNGTPTVPSRWLQRLDTVLKAAGLPSEYICNGPYLAYVQLLKKPDNLSLPVSRPMPRPPAGLRPRKLPVTAIEAWMRDPYAIYAKYILRLRKLEPLEDTLDAAFRGSLIHAIFDRFIKEYPDTLPLQARSILMAYTIEALGDMTQDVAFWGFWEPRFSRLIDWFLMNEEKWRYGAIPLKTECEGSCAIPEIDFTITAKADRIDRLNTGELAIIDYKTGTIPSEKEARRGLSPQLPLEAMIAMKGGFDGIKASDVGYLGFWKLSGNTDGGEEKTITPNAGESFADIALQAEAGLRDLVQSFSSPDTPYISLPRADKAPKYQDYAHLARVAEWATQEDDSEEAA